MDRIIEQKGWSPKKRLPYWMGGILLLVLVLWIVLGDHSSQYKVDRDSLSISEVLDGAFNDYVRLNGKVEPGITVQLSAKESGVVESITAQEGQKVKAGDVIITLSNPNLRQQILDSEAQLAEKQNMLRDTEISMEKERLSMKQDMLSLQTDVTRLRRTYDQQKALYEERLTSRDDYLKAEEDYNLAEAKLELLLQRIQQDSIYRGVQVTMLRENLSNMMLNLRLVRSRADNLVIRAEYDGQLGNLQTADGKDILLGQNINSGQSVGQVNVLDSYRIQVSVDEHYIDRVSRGLRGVVERNGKTYGVVVQKVYPEVNAGKFRCDLVFDNPDEITSSQQEQGGPRVGQTYYINLQLGEPTTAILLPRGGFYQSTGGQWVFVLSADGSSAVRRQVKIGRQNPQYYEVLEGLQPGERVITSGYDTFSEVEKLKIH